MHTFIDLKKQKNSILIFIFFVSLCLNHKNKNVYYTEPKLKELELASDPPKIKVRRGSL